MEQTFLQLQLFLLTSEKNMPTIFLTMVLFAEEMEY
jgi:hypothetical protein